MTPMISWLSPLIVIARPMTARSPPNRRAHRTMTEDHHSRRARHVVGGLEASTERWHGAEHVEVFVRHLLALQ